jgi:tetratricopeptide (TPR) repeat protein/tRNA A-37 threonylcarbamoyl transferase component Bud32
MYKKSKLIYEPGKILRGNNFRYEIKRKLGQGGMGEVWLVKCIELQKPLVMKISRLIIEKNLDDFLTRFSFVRQFQKEAESLLLLQSHPNIVKCYFIDIIDGKLHIFLEYIDGLTLSDYIKSRESINAMALTRSFIDWEESFTIAIQICNGMIYAHSKGLIHLDLKPSNILITNEKSPLREKGIVSLITDFGLANVMNNRILQDPHQKTDGSHLMDLDFARSDDDSNTGHELLRFKGGTPAYMSPEQFKTLSMLDEQSDIYSFGVTMFEIITSGIKPYYLDDIFLNQASPDAIFAYYERMKLEYEILDIYTIRSDCPPKLKSLVERCLRKNSSDRYHSFNEIKVDLISIYREKLNNEYSEKMNERDYIIEDNYEETLLRGHSYLQLDKYTVAITIGNKTIELDPNSTHGYNLKGSALYYSGSYDEAILCYDKAIEIDPKNSELYIGKGNALNAIDNYREAISCFDKAIDIDPTHNVAYHNKGVALNSLGNLREAISCFDKAIDIDPNYIIAYSIKGAVLTTLGNYQEAISCFDEGIQIDPTFVGLYVNKGNALGALGNYQEAISCFDEGIQIDPTFVGLYVNKGRILSEISNYQEAISCYDKAIDIDPNSVSAYINKGGLLGTLGNFREAISCFDKAIDIDPSTMPYYRAMEIDPIKSSSKLAYVNKGKALGALEKYHEAISCFDKAIEIDAKYLDAYDSKGTALMFLSKYDDALACFDKAIEIDAKYLDAYCRKGRIYILLNNYDDALACFDKAIDIDPQCHEAVSLKELLISWSNEN